MPRIYKRKTESGLTPPGVMSRAVEAVQNGMKTRDAASHFGVPKSTLNRYVNKVRLAADARMEPNYKHKQVFSEAQERVLGDYLKRCSNMFYGLTTNQTRSLAYEMALRNNVQNIPQSWNDNKQAGKEWLHHFLQRHPDLSLRTPEATSLARASAFNRENVAKFFKILSETVATAKASAFSIYNLDESGCTTVQCPPKVLAPKGQKQVGQITSQERGELVTVCCIVGAMGSSLPPVLVFPRKNFKGFMMNGAPEGSLGLASGNGWMNSDIFPKVMEHFISFARPSKDNQVILIMDNHQSHLPMPSLEMAKENFVHVITLPPHTSNKTQPLDRTVFGPMKRYFNSAANSLMLQNPGKNITIYDMASLINSAWTRAATPENIMSGFRVSGIWPLDELVFEDREYLPSAVTDQPLPDQGPSASSPTNQATASTSSESITPLSAPTVLAAGHTTGEATTPASAPTVLEAAPTTSASVPAVLEAATTTSASVPTVLEAAPTTSASVPTVLEAATTTSASVPTVLEAAPTTSASVPTVLEAAPTTSASVPTVLEAAPTTSASVPTVLEAAPTTSASVPTVLEAATTTSASAPTALAAGLTTCEATTSAPSSTFSNAAFNSADANITSPAVFRGYPKAPQRTISRRGRKRGKPMLATASPELKRMRLETSKKDTKKHVKKQLVLDSDSDDVSLDELIERDEDTDNNDTDNEDQDTLVLGPVDHPKKGDYIVCEYAMKTAITYYIGMVNKERDDDDEIEVEFLKRKFGNKFIKSTADDIWSVHIDQVKAILPPPVISGTTARTKGVLIFNVSFGKISLH